MDLRNRIQKKIKETESKLKSFTPNRSEHMVTRPYKDKRKYTRKIKHKNTE